MELVNLEARKKDMNTGDNKFVIIHLRNVRQVHQGQEYDTGRRHR